MNEAENIFDEKVKWFSSEVNMKTLQILILIICLAVFANGQTSKETTVLTGLVYDDMGAVITNAKIIFRGTDNTERIIFNNDEGVFEINLRAGNYSIQVESAGFQTFKIEKYRIAPSYKGKMNFDIVLEVRPCDDCEMIEGTPVKENKKP